MKNPLEMSISKLVNQIKTKRVLAIDPASHSLAWTVCDLAVNTYKLVATGKIDFSTEKDMDKRILAVVDGLEDLCVEYKPSHAVIEQSVYIQNFQSSRIISYIIGCAWGVLAKHCSSVEDVNPLVWKPAIGYKNINKLDKSKLMKEHGQKGFQTKLANERKERVKNIVIKNIGSASDDSDINDSTGISLWYYVNYGFGNIL